MTHNLGIICTTLSDGSKVYDVQLHAPLHYHTRIACPTEQDAYALMEGMRKLLGQHALDEVRCNFIETEERA
jgi:hypothetical protein